jgi:hypothetical protein
MQDVIDLTTNGQKLWSERNVHRRDCLEQWDCTRLGACAISSDGGSSDGGQDSQSSRRALHGAQGWRMHQQGARSAHLWRSAITIMHCTELYIVGVVSIYIDIAPVGGTTIATVGVADVTAAAPVALCIHCRWCSHHYCSRCRPSRPSTEDGRRARPVAFGTHMHPQPAALASTADRHCQEPGTA